MTTTDRQPDPYGTWDPSQATDDPDGLPDRAIVPLIESLRARGIVTLQSCAGHLKDQPDGSQTGRDGTLWVRADSVDGAHIRLFLTGYPFDRVQYAYLPDGPHWEFGWHPDRAEEAMRALGGLLPAVPAEPATAPDRQPATPGQALRWAADRLDNMHVFSGSESRTLLCRWADELDAAPATPDADALDTVLADLSPEAAEVVRRVARERDSLARRCALRFAETQQLRAERDMLAKAVAHPRRLVDATQLPEPGPLSTASPAGTEGA